MDRIKLIASEGMVYTDGETCGKIILLGVGDSPENWWEVPEEGLEESLEEMEAV